MLNLMSDGCKSNQNVRTSKAFKFYYQISNGFLRHIYYLCRIKTTLDKFYIL